MADTEIPVDALAAAHDAIDLMVQLARTPITADEVWQSLMGSVEHLSEDSIVAHFALLLTVALQRLAAR